MSNGTCNDECIKVEDPCDYYASPVTIDASCRCPHLDAFLPSTLDSGGFGIFSEDGSSSNLNEVDSDGSKRNSINRLHFASLYSRPDVGVMNIGLANKRGDSVRQTVPLSDQNKPILDTSLNEVNRNLAGSNIKRNHQTQHYPFGEEEYKTDVISSGGVSKHYYPIFPGYFMERAKDERMHEKASWEWNIRELDRRKRCRSLETDVTDLTTPTLHDPGTKENLRTGSSESLSSDLTKTDMVASRTSSIPDPLCSEEGKEKRIPTTILHKHHLRHNAKIEESIDLTSNQNGEIHYSQSRFDYLKNMESKLSKQQELLSAAQIDTTNYEHSEKKRKAVSIDRSTQNKQTEEHYPDRLRNGNIKELSKRSENYNVTSCPTSPADHLPAGYQSFIQATKRQEKDVLIAENKVEEWLEVIRQSRVNYWKHQHHSERRNRSCGQVNGWGGNHANTLHHKTNNVTIDCSPYCKQCSTVSKQGKTHVRMPRGDELMMCLECSMIACGPVSLSYNQKSKQHLLQHFLVSGHSFGITCGTLGAIFCMKCGDFVHCEPLEVEKERVDIREKVGWLGWSRTGYVNRSFKLGVGLEDFLLIPDGDFPGGYCNKADEITSNDDDIMVSDRKNSQNRSKYHGGMVVWRGFRAIYPRNVRNELVQAARRTYHRWKIFHGKLCDDSSLAWSSKALQLSVLQNDRGADCWKIQNPVGFYNMGNICFMSSVLQCIINLTPLQRYFLCEVKHDYEACRELRKRSEDQPVSKPPVKIDVTATKLPDKDDTSICLACEMDKLFLAYHSSTIGMDVSEAIDSPLDPSSSFSPSNHDHFSNDKKSPIGQCITPIDQSEIPTKLNKGEREESCRGSNNLLGMPLIASDLLVSAWRCKEMVHLAGYEQRDAHEFLQALLDLIGKHCNRYRDISKKLRQETISSIQAKGLSTFEVDDDSKSDIEGKKSYGIFRCPMLTCVYLFLFSQHITY